MAQESNNPDKSKNLDQEVRDLISTLTGRLRMINNPNKPGVSTNALNQGDEDDGQGVRIITLAGSNVGATMRGEMDEKFANDDLGIDQDDFIACVNSNFQAINNSIMLGGSYDSNDPGVHLDIADYTDDHGSHEHHEKKKKGKKHKKGGHKSDDHHDQHSKKEGDEGNN